MLRIELQCDIKFDGVDGGCHTLSRGESLSASARNGQELEAARGVRVRARKAGWKHIQGLGWACPSCVKLMEQQ